MHKITLNDVKENKEFKALITEANNNLEKLGYTEHGLRHVGYVSNTTANLLKELGYDDRTVELGAITGWLHDIGNVINRKHHAISGAILAFNLLSKMNMDINEISLIVAAIGNHEEQTGFPVSPISAALIIADKSDAHRSRVRKIHSTFDIHDRVNLSIQKNYLAIDKDKKKIKLVILMDKTSSLMEYLQIYLSRMILCEKAASFLGYTFELVINGSIINRQRKNNRLNTTKGETTVSED